MLIFFVSLLLHVPACAAKLDSLSRFYSEFREFRAAFAETVWGPDGGAVYRCSGELVLSLGHGARLSVETPDTQLLVVRGDTVFTYLPSENTVYVSVSPLVASLVMPPAALGQLKDGYGCDEQGEELVFRALTEGAPAQEVKMVLEQGWALPRLLEVRDWRGNTYRVRFRDVQVNPGVPRETFSPTYPEGTRFEWR